MASSSSVSSSSVSSSSSTSGRYIVLKKYVSCKYVRGRTQAYILRLVVEEAHDIAEEIFVFLRQNDRDTFSNVASPEDLTTYPATDPGTGSFFRLNEVSMVFRELFLLEGALTDILTDIKDLIAALDGFDSTLVNTTVVLT